MTTPPTYQEVERRLARFEAINRAFCNIAEAVIASNSLEGLYRAIHLALEPVIDTTNFYIAIYNVDDDSLRFPYIRDSVDGFYPTALDVSKTASLTAEVIRRQKPLLIRKAEALALQAASGRLIPSCSPAEIWLGAPLKIPHRIIGVMAVQSYTTADCYDQIDLEVLAASADLVALSLEQKRIKEALMASEERFRLIVTSVREGIICLDNDNRITFANGYLTEMLGYRPEELYEQPFTMLLVDEDLENFHRRQQQRITGENEQFERRFLTKSGDKRWAIVSASPLMAAGERIIGSFGAITDITERKKAEMELQQKNDELEKAFRQIKTLRGIVPICMSCKKIRDDQGYWNQVEVYVRNHTEAEFSHGICPDCLSNLYPEFASEDP